MINSRPRKRPAFLTMGNRFFRSVNATAALAIAVIFAAGSIRASGAPARNLVDNGGFQMWSPAPDRGGAREFPRFGPEGIPAGWSWGAEVSPFVTDPSIHCDAGIFRDDGVKRQGTCSVRFENPHVWDIVALWRQIAVEPNTVYLISCWSRGEAIHSANGDGVVYWARWGPTQGFDRHNTVIASAPSVHSGTFDWTRYDFTVETDADTQVMDITVQLRNASGTAWFDDFEVAKLRSVVHVPTF